MRLSTAVNGEADVRGVLTVTARIPTPRPTFTRPTLITHENAVRHRWGDSASGFVEDSVVVSSRELHVLEFTIAPGARFVQSPANPTIFDADVVYVVLAGALWVRDPATGEACMVSQGEALWIQPRTWHQAFNRTDVEARVCEFFSPPPARGTASDFARAQPYMTDTTPRWTAVDSRWPLSRAPFDSERRLRPITRSDLLWALLDEDGAHRAGTALSTEHLRVRLDELDPGGVATVSADRADSAIAWVSGHGTAKTTMSGAAEQFQVSAGDYLYLPRGSAATLTAAETMCTIWEATGSPDPGDGGNA
jgi:mannose-6-phosphate isomerase-like protein (cupin superfamily)